MYSSTNGAIQHSVLYSPRAYLLITFFPLLDQATGEVFDKLPALDAAFAAAGHALHIFIAARAVFHGANDIAVGNLRAIARHFVQIHNNLVKKESLSTLPYNCISRIMPARRST